MNCESESLNISESSRVSQCCKQAFSRVFLVDHSWTFLSLEDAKRCIESVPGLKDRMNALLGPGEPEVERGGGDDPGHEFDEVSNVGGRGAGGRENDDRVVDSSIKLMESIEVSDTEALLRRVVECAGMYVVDGGRDAEPQVSELNIVFTFTLQLFLVCCQFFLFEVIYG